MTDAQLTQWREVFDRFLLDNDAEALVLTRDLPDVLRALSSQNATLVVESEVSRIFDPVNNGVVTRDQFLAVMLSESGRRFRPSTYSSNTTTTSTTTASSDYDEQDQWLLSMATQLFALSRRGAEGENGRTTVTAQQVADVLNDMGEEISEQEVREWLDVSGEDGVYEWQRVCREVGCSDGRWDSILCTIWRTGAPPGGSSSSGWKSHQEHADALVKHLSVDSSSNIGGGHKQAHDDDDDDDDGGASCIFCLVSLRTEAQVVQLPKCQHSCFHPSCFVQFVAGHLKRGRVTGIACPVCRATVETDIVAPPPPPAAAVEESSDPVAAAAAAAATTPAKPQQCEQGQQTQQNEQQQVAVQATEGSAAAAAAAGSGSALIAMSIGLPQPQLQQHSVAVQADVEEEEEEAAEQAHDGRKPLVAAVVAAPQQQQEGQQQQQQQQRAAMIQLTDLRSQLAALQNEVTSLERVSAVGHIR